MKKITSPRNKHAHIPHETLESLQAYYTYTKSRERGEEEIEISYGDIKPIDPIYCHHLFLLGLRSGNMESVENFPNSEKRAINYILCVRKISKLAKNEVGFNHP